MQAAAQETRPEQQQQEAAVQETVGASGAVKTDAAAAASTTTTEGAPQQESQGNAADDKNNAAASSSAGAGASDDSAATVPVDPDIFPLLIKSPTGMMIEMQFSKSDTLIDLRQLISEVVETCYITNFDLTFEGKTLNNFKGHAGASELTTLGSIENLGANSVITMTPIAYDDKSARAHVARVLQLLDAPIDAYFLSKSGTLPSKDETNGTSRTHFPSFTPRLKSTNGSDSTSSSSPSDMDVALDCDLEFKRSLSASASASAQSSSTSSAQTLSGSQKGSSKKEKASKEHQSSSEEGSTTTTSSTKGSKKDAKSATTSTAATSTKDQQASQQQQQQQSQSQQQRDQKQNENSNPELQQTDSRFIFGVESFSMNALKKLLAGSSESIPRCVNSLTLSGWNPPPSHRRLAGDLFYIEITTLEGRTLHVTACRNGFFVNGSSDSKFVPTKASGNKSGEFHTLVGLLHEMSRAFLEGFVSMLGVRSSLHPFEATPLPLPVQGRWCAVPGEEHTFDRNRACLSMSSTNPSVLNAGIASISGVAGSNTSMSNGVGGPLTGFEPRNIQNRDWNEEYQSCKELPSETEDQRILRDRTIWKVHSEFVEAATKIAVGIVNKEFAPINPMDPKAAHVYIQNNIFFTFATFNDSSPELKDLGVEEGSYYLSRNDLLGIQTFNSLDMPGIYTLPTVLIDYRGFRLSAQSIIPGILQGDHLSLLKYGSLDSGKTVKWDEEFHELISTATSRLHLKSHKVRDTNDNEAELASPVELKGIRGADGRKYILDLVRLTPRDPNFEHIPTAIFRPELVEEFCAYTAQMQIEQKTKELLMEQQKSQDQGSSSSSSSLTEEDIMSKIQVEPILFNPNCLIPPSSHIRLCDSEEQQQADLAQIRQLSEFLVNLAIPSLVADEATLEFNILDGPSLTELMHSRGINMRYLGKVAEISRGLPFLHRLCLQEMVVRAAKCHFNELLRSSPDELALSNMEAFLNGLFGHIDVKETDAKDQQPQQQHPQDAPSTAKSGKKNKGKGRQQTSIKSNDLSPQNLRNTIHRLVKDKFNYDLPEGYLLNNNATTSCSEFGISKLSMLRSFCLRVGLVIACETFDFSKKKPFSTSDLIDLQPIIKQTSPKSSLAHELLRSGKAALATGNFEQAFELLNQALVTFQQIKGPMNFETATCLSNLATLLFNANDFQQAILHQHKALIISRRVLGHDSALTASIYQLIGLQCHSSGHTEFALKYFLRSRFICELIYGTDHPETATTLTNIAIMYQDLGYHVRSLKYLKEALRINETLLGPDHFQTSASLHALAVTLSMLGQYKESLMHERRAYKILFNLFGNDDPRVKESSSWLQHFTARAVEAQKELRKVQEEETRKFLAQTPPVLAKALKGLNLTNPSIDIKQLEAIVARTKQQMQTQQLSSKGAKFKKATTPAPAPAPQQQQQQQQKQPQQQPSQPKKS